MNYALILIAVIIVTCALLNNASTKIGMPVLLGFLLLGIFFGNSGILPIKFDNFAFAEKMSTVALIVIIFYGGFGTNWKAARGVAVESGILASVGVVLTALITGVFCHICLKWGWIESFLMGSVVSSTDAASVFSILRTRKLGLKNGIAPLLELESGANDPCSYMLTVLCLSLLKGSVGVGQTIWLVVAQIGFGVLFGVGIAQLAIFAMRRINFSAAGFNSLFVLAVALLSYAVPSLVGGNGFLSAYIVGIIMGNNSFHGKKYLVGFFDSMTDLMQVMVFFLLGLLARPQLMLDVLLPALLIFVFMLVVSRPATIALILGPFRKYPIKQRLFISFSGLRGASSIVFAIVAAMGAPDMIQHDILNIVFCIVLLSISLQGYFLPKAAKFFDSVDQNSDVMKTFNDFSEEMNIHFTDVVINENSPWRDKLVRDLQIPKDFLICNVIRPDGTRIIPDGNTLISVGDKMILFSSSYRSDHDLYFVEKHIEKGNKLIGLSIREYRSDKVQIALIQRGEQNIIPHGDTVFMEGDVLYLNRTSSTL